MILFALNILIINSIFAQEIIDWQQIDGNLYQVSIGNDGSLWGTDDWQDIYRYDDDQSWTQINPGKSYLSQISVGNANNIWGVSEYTTSNFWGTVDEHYDIYKRINDEEWQQIDGQLKHVSCGYDNTVWGVNSDNYIYRYDGDSNGIPSPWTQISGRLKQISVGNANNIVGINDNGDVYKLKVSSNEATSISGSPWTMLTNPDNINFKYVDVSTDENGDIWATDDDHRIYRYVSGTWDFYSGSLRRIESSNGILVGVDGDGNIFTSTFTDLGCN